MGQQPKVANTGLSVTDSSFGKNMCCPLVSARGLSPLRIAVKRREGCSRCQPRNNQRTSSIGVRTTGMPTTKKQADVPKISKEQSKKEDQQGQEEKLEKEQEAAEVHTIPQPSSAALHNYPDVKIPLEEPEPEQKGTPQPKTGAAATAKEK